MTSIGVHLLGRIPSPPDERDYRLENFLRLGYPETDPEVAPDPITLVTSAIAELKATTVAYPRWAATQYPDVTQTHWWKALNYLAQVLPQPPPPPPADVIWTDPEAVLDQGNYGTCVGNGCAQWGNTLPVDDRWDEVIARELYYEATVLDGSPDKPTDPPDYSGGQQGATVRSGVKSLKNRGRLNTYAVTYSVDTIREWIDSKGPVIMGTNWTTAMFTPDANGYIVPTGSVEGGHCYLCVGDLLSEGALKFLNSWGSGWGLGGYFKMKYPDVQMLLNQQGEAWTSAELAISV